MEKVLNTKVKVVNDADAAGIAEMTFGKGKTLSDKLVIFITLGTGIGSAIFYKGVLVPNSELGHLFYKKSVFEKYASNSARELKGLGWNCLLYTSYSGKNKRNTEHGHFK